MLRKRVTVNVVGIVLLGGAAVLLGFALGAVVFRDVGPAPGVLPAASAPSPEAYPWSHPRTYGPGADGAGPSGPEAGATAGPEVSPGAQGGAPSPGEGVSAAEEKPGPEEVKAGPRATGTEGGMVFITPSGKRYHSTRDCPALRRSSRVMAVTEEEARKKGLTPCKLCY